MTPCHRPLNILFVEDDPDYLKDLPRAIEEGLEEAGYAVLWDTTDSFERAKALAAARYYDLILCDVYINAKDHTLDHSLGAPQVVEALRDRRFCAVVYFSTGSKPAELKTLWPFERYADKVKPKYIIDQVKDVLSTEIPLVAAELYEELGRSTGSYLWGLLGNRWKDLQRTRATEPDVLRRLVRRKAATQFSRVTISGDENKEVEEIYGCEYYTYPPISGGLHRLGEMLRNRKDDKFRIVLTPHCLLTIQKGKKEPKVDALLTVGVRPAKEVLEACNCTTEKALAKLLQSPARNCVPEGRYWALPGFLDISESFCDFLDVRTIELTEVDKGFEDIATLEAPLSEALQSCFIAFHLPVGLPVLLPGGMLNLLTTEGLEAAPE